MENMVVSLADASGYLQATLSGPFSLEKAQSTFVEILSAAERHQLAKILIDGTRITGQPSIIDRFYYGEFVAGAASRVRVGSGQQTLQFAYVLVPPVRDVGGLGEMVATNRGMKVKTFADRADALRWLGIADHKTST